MIKRVGQMGFITGLGLMLVALTGCRTVQVVATPVVYDPQTMEIVGQIEVEMNQSYCRALGHELSRVNADGLLNPQVEIETHTLPFGLNVIFPARTSGVLISGIAFRFKDRQSLTGKIRIAPERENGTGELNRK